MAISAKKFRNDLKKSGIFYTDKALAEEIKALLPENITETLWTRTQRGRL